MPCCMCRRVTSKTPNTGTGNQGAASAGEARSARSGCSGGQSPRPVNPVRHCGAFAALKPRCPSRLRLKCEVMSAQLWKPLLIERGSERTLVGRGCVKTPKNFLATSKIGYLKSFPDRRSSRVRDSVRSDFQLTVSNNVFTLPRSTAEIRAIFRLEKTVNSSLFPTKLPSATKFSDRGTLHKLHPDGATVPASFTIDYDCGGTYAGSVSVAAGGSQIVSNIPTGSSCTVSEPALTPIVGYTWGTPVSTGSPATIGNRTPPSKSVCRCRRSRSCWPRSR